MLLLAVHSGEGSVRETRKYQRRLRRSSSLETAGKVGMVLRGIVLLRRSDVQHQPFFCGVSE